MYKIDTNRTARCGFPEVIYGSGKTAAQVADIMMAMIQAGSWPIIASRIDEEKALNISNLINEKIALFICNSYLILLICCSAIQCSCSIMHTTEKMAKIIMQPKAVTRLP